MTAKDRKDSASRRVVAGLAVALLGCHAAGAQSDTGLTSRAPAIHQEITFKAPPQRVYALLTDQNEFQKVIVLSGAAASGKIKPGIAAHIGRDAGAPFSLFGGFVVGRNIELVPGQRLVQAWRPQNWAPGVYSIVKFELAAQGSGTLLKFDQTGFPASDAVSLAQGWYMNYWNPMTAVLASHPEAQ